MLITKINQILDYALNKNKQIHDHMERTSLFSFALSKALNLNPKEMELAYFTGLVHDIGKINDEQKSQEHQAINGSSMLQFIDGFEDMSEIILHLNEKWNGEGYPSELKNEDIPLISRIVSIASSYDEMRNIEELSHEEAVEKLRSLAGTSFDPNMVEPFISIIEFEDLI